MTATVALACDPSDPAILRSVEDFARDTGTTAASVGCETGAFSTDNCKVAGIKIDRSCSGLDRVQEIQDAIRDIRGAGGLGCVNSVNGPLAAALLKVFSLSPPFAVCCDQCQGPGLSREAVPGSSCGMSLPQGPNGQETVVLNTRGAGTVFGTGTCGTTGSPQPVRKLLLHEMLHVAGLAGAKAHSGGGATDPETGTVLEERDFLADPVYGCEKLCYGTPANRNAISCLACSRGFASATDLTHAKPSVLSARLREAEQLAASDPTRVPDACRALWDRPTDPGRRHLRAYVDGLRDILTSKEELVACAKDQMVLSASSLRKITSATEFADRCATQAQNVRTACAGFVAAAGCRRTGVATGLYAEETVNLCREAIGLFQQPLITAVRTFGQSTSPELRSRVVGFDCSRYFPETALCPGLGVGTELVRQSCANALNAR